MKLRFTLIAVVVMALALIPLRAQLNISGNPPLPVAYGGTGAATLTGMVSGNGTGAFTASTSVGLADGAICSAPSLYRTSDSTLGLGFASDQIIACISGTRRLSFLSTGIQVRQATDAVYSLCDDNGNNCWNLIRTGSGTGTLGTTVTVGVTSTITITTADLQMRGNDVLKDGLPACSGAGCVMGATSTNTSMNMTTTTTGAADITITFSAAFDNAPSCFANNDTTGNLLRVTTVTAGSIHAQGVTVSGDTLRIGCFGN